MGYSKQPSRYIPVVRALAVLSVGISWSYLDELQYVLDNTWLWMKVQPAYRSVVFESVFTAFLGGFITGMYWLMEHNPYWNIVENYSNRKEKMHTLGPLQLARWAFSYMFMFLCLDPITPKRYGHVDPKRYEERTGYIHSERLLPESAPSVGTLVYESVVGLLLYDAIFFVIHYTLHNVPFLYRSVHRHHHDQRIMTTYETDHLHPVERFLLVITGNESMRLVQAHPLSRNVFNVWLIFLLFNNHCGLDFPLSLEKIIPFKLMYGPADHEVHHMSDGRSHYQPFFRYLDSLLLWCRPLSAASCNGDRGDGLDATRHQCRITRTAEISSSEISHIVPEIMDGSCQQRMCSSVAACR
eukprot:scpid60289/ scgid8319/ Cholesterol 25-hydroxylase; Cholesterol 25-monooxygenase